MTDDLPTPEDQARLARLRRLKALKEGNGLAFYKPHSKQELFHSAAWAKLRYLRTGNRFGKSTCGAAEDCAYALGQRIWYPAEHPNRTLGIPKHSTKGLIIVSDWDKAREIFTSQERGQGQGKLFKLLPGKSIKHIHKNQAGEIDCIHVESLYGGVSMIYIDTVKSFLSNPMGQESSDWDWIHVDEPIPKDQWVANSRGLVDRNGSAWFTCTPLNYMWINDMFIPRTRIREEFLDGLSDKARSKWVLTGSMFDNKSLKAEGIEMFIQSLSEEEKAARLYGKPRALAGTIYSEFEYDRHVYIDTPHGWKDHDQPPENYTIRVSIDPHPKTPHAVLYAATAPTGEVFFYQETFRKTLIDDLCDEIHDKTFHKAPYRVICDPFAFQENPVDGTMWANVFWQKGIMIEKAPKMLTAGIQEVKRQLRMEKNWYFSSALMYTLMEFDRYVWDPKKEKPIDEHDHLMECLYRLALTGLEYVDMEPDHQSAYEPLDLSNINFNVPFLTGYANA